MKKIFALCAIAFSLSQNLFAQTTFIDTVGGRYWEEIFTSNTITSDVVYGSNINVNNATQSLKMDIYEPVGDTVQWRPLLVLAHGGSFIAGSKTDADVVSLCNHFAKMGYVCASIEYRLGMGFPIDSIHAAKAVLRAMQDMKAAIRFFRKDAAGPNTYHTHPDFIFAGGSSAGAFTALHLAYMDSAEVPAYVGLAAMGGIEGASGNAGFASEVKGIINLCGALGDSSWLNAGDIPFVSMHGTNDGTVPFGSAIISVLTIPIINVDGSGSLKPRADHVGVYNPFYIWYGADHVPYLGTTAAALAYMDTTVNFVKAFLRPFFGIPLNLGVHNFQNGAAVNLFPNPSDGLVYFSFDKNGLSKSDVVISDVAGKFIDQFQITSSSYLYSNKTLQPGLYFVQINSDNLRVTKKLVIE